MLDVTLIPVLSDNYAYVLTSGDDIAIVDAGEALPVIDYLEAHNLTPTIIFNTHHHHDHIGGNNALKQKYGAKIIAPEKDKHRIEGIDQGVSEGDQITFGDEIIEIMETPGHTSGHICLWFPKSHVLFSGDTLFAMGCGRAFEGTAKQLFDAFQRFKPFPDDTKIYCGHEYTESNGKFCLNVDPDNQDLLERMRKVVEKRSRQKPTIPTTIELEKKTNVFMRAKTAEEFANLRKSKDNF
ncbi:MAG TPA: hydroxyacylglutathione hydrolase [Alphaproteobacteria bacterium]|nr:hydroxyacylglutathione hydrolase [Alphaproteobacteria bacterium]